MVLVLREVCLAVVLFLPSVSEGFVVGVVSFRSFTIFLLGVFYALLSTVKLSVIS